MNTPDTAELPADAGSAALLPETVDHVAVARLYGEPLFALPQDLYIPPDALEVFLEAFEGPLDLLLYLIRKQNFNILDIPMAAVTRQYLSYVDEIRSRNLELAAEYLLMAAMLIEIKSRMLLPPRKSAEGQEPEDRAPSWCAACWNTSKLPGRAAAVRPRLPEGAGVRRAGAHAALSRRRAGRPAAPGPTSWGAPGWCSTTRSRARS
jgi:hypothetical protein